MIQAKDLRIGNCIFYNGNISKVTPEEIDGIYSLTYKGEGIPLSPEILEKAGFNRDSEGWYLSADNKLYDPLELNGVGLYSQRNTSIFAFKHGSSILKRGIKYVHQLQNIYHALTGEELTITL